MCFQQYKHTIDLIKSIVTLNTQKASPYIFGWVAESSEGKDSHVSWYVKSTPWEGWKGRARPLQHPWDVTLFVLCTVTQKMRRCCVGRRRPISRAARVRRSRNRWLFICPGTASQPQEVRPNRDDPSSIFFLLRLLLMLLWITQRVTNGQPGQMTVYGSTQPPSPLSPTLPSIRGSGRRGGRAGLSGGVSIRSFGEIVYCCRRSGAFWWRLLLCVCVCV